MNSYQEMRRRQQEEVDALPLHWAFTEEHFDKTLQELGLTRADTDKLCKTWGGGFCLASDADMIVTTLARHRADLRAEIRADKTGLGFIKDMFVSELRNHEYGYTLETEEAVNACGFTETEIEEDSRLKRGLEAACKSIREAEGFDF